MQSGKIFVDRHPALCSVLGLLAVEPEPLGIYLFHYPEAGLILRVVTDRDFVAGGIHSERRLSCLNLAGIKSIQGPYAAFHSTLLLHRAEFQVITMGNAVAVADDQRRTFI